MNRLSLTILLFLAACASGRPDLEVTSATPASVTVWGRWSMCFTCVEPEPVVSDQQMTDVASDHCSQYGKAARKTLVERYESGRTITFDCVAQ